MLIIQVAQLAAKSQMEGIVIQLWLESAGKRASNTFQGHSHKS